MNKNKYIHVDNKYKINIKQLHNIVNPIYYDFIRIWNKLKTKGKNYEPIIDENKRRIMYVIGFNLIHKKLKLCLFIIFDTDMDQNYIYKIKNVIHCSAPFLSNQGIMTMLGDVCLDIDIFKKSLTNNNNSYVNLLSKNNCFKNNKIKIKKPGAFVINLVHKINRSYNVKKCALQDASYITGNQLGRISYTILSIFKRGKTFYESHGFKAKPTIELFKKRILNIYIRDIDKYLKYLYSKINDEKWYVNKDDFKNNVFHINSFNEYYKDWKELVNEKNKDIKSYKFVDFMMVLFNNDNNKLKRFYGIYDSFFSHIDLYALILSKEKNINKNNIFYIYYGIKYSVSKMKKIY